MVRSCSGACHRSTAWACSRSTARDEPAAAEVLREVLLALSGAVEVVVVDLSRPDHEIFTALAPSVDAMALLAGAGICDLGGQARLPST